MSVENGVVISGFNKDYEVMSWNEQREITQIKGMLTIAFLVVSLCSHKDSWKQLYLIIKIPYMVDMPTNQESKSLEEQLEEEKERLIKLWDAFQELEKENLSLKQELGLVDTEWQKERDCAWRISQSTKEMEKYTKLPIHFDEKRVKSFNLWEDMNTCSFDYYWGSKSFEYDSYKIPYSLYLFLCGRKQKIKMETEQKNKEKTSKKPITGINSLKQLKKHCEQFDEYDYRYTYFNEIRKFILEHIGERFQTGDIRRTCKGIASATLSKHLKMFEKCNIIYKIRQGIYQVNIK